MLPDRRPLPVTIRPGHPGFIALDKYRCDIRTTDSVHTLRLTLPGRRTRLALSLGRASGLDFCGETASRLVAVTPVLAAQRTAFAPTTALAFDPTGLNVLRDIDDGQLDTHWSCGSLRAAIRRLPVGGPIYSAIPGLLIDAAARACATAIRTTKDGATRSSTIHAFGVPVRMGPNCSVWNWAPAGGSIDGVRICFDAGRVDKVGTAVHG
jgi:hypothetical protein